MVASSSFPASEQQTTRPCRGLHGRDPPTRGAPDSKTNLRRVNMSSTERARPVGGLRGVNGANCSSSHPNPPEDGKGSNPSLSACQTYLGARPVLAALRTAAAQRPRGSAARPRPRRPARALSRSASELIWGPARCSRALRARCASNARAAPPRAPDSVGWHGASRRQPPFALRVPSKAVTVRLAPRASGGGG